MNCTLTSQSSPSAADQPAGERSRGRAGRSISNYIASPARIASRVFALAEHVRPSRQMPSTVCSWPGRPAPSRAAAGSRPPSDGSRAPRRPTAGSSVPGRASSSACAAVDRRRQHPEAARALGLGGFMQTSRPGIAELGAPRPELVGVRGRDTCAGEGIPSRSASRGGLGLVAGRARSRPGSTTSTGIAKRSPPARDRAHLGRGLREHAVDALALGQLRRAPPRTPGRPRRHPWKRSHRKRRPTRRACRCRPGAPGARRSRAAPAAGAARPARRGGDQDVQRIAHSTQRYDLEHLGQLPAALDAVRAREVADVLLVRVVAVLLAGVAAAARPPWRRGGAPRGVT